MTGDILNRRFQKTMTFLRLTSIAVRRCGRFVLRVSSCWQIVLAAVMLASPCAGFFEGQEVELTESSVPAEERGDCSEFLAVAGSVPSRGTFERTTSPWGGNRASVDCARFRSSDPRPGRFVTGHRLANGLRAPLRC